MSLTASMWTGVSGLLAHGEKMNVIGNNIANVSTLGFKGQRMDFADFVYQNKYCNSGIGQVGRGVKIGAIMQNFDSGSFEASTEATDLAISGRGFFKVNKIGSDQAFYTRAGNFRFNNEGYLTDPNGLAVQGWRVDNDGGVMQAAGGMSPNNVNKSKSDIIGSGVPTDVKLDTYTVFPQQTTNITFKVNLPKPGEDKARNTSNPFASLVNVWDGSQPPASPSTPPIASSSYAHQTTMEVYDEAGTKHKVTVYYDKVANADYDGGTNGNEMWEYMVTMDPAEDQRMYFDTTSGELKKVNETKMGGVLMSGTMTFNSSGGIVNQTGYTWGGSQDPTTNPTSFTNVPDPSDPLNSLSVINLDPSNLNNWQPAAISTNGYPMMVANFTGILDAQTPGSTNGSKYNIEMDFGLKVGNYNMPWTNQNALGSLDVVPYEANGMYKAGNPLTGPKYLELNPGYDSTKPWNNGNAYKYKINGLAYGPNGCTSPASDVQAKVHALYGDITMPVGSMGTMIDPTAVPAGSGQMNLPPLAGLTMSYNASGAPVYHMPVPAPVGADLTRMTAAITELNRLGYDTVAGSNGKTANEIIGEQLKTMTTKDRSVFKSAVAANANQLAQINKPVVIDAQACTNVGTSFSSNQAQNGYGYGNLTSWNVDADGVLYGQYSNGVQLPLWQLTMYDFNCNQGLRREGNNLFSQTRESGEAKSGPAGISGLGTINGYQLEQSNVDMSTEFVQMITTQRGFQSNSKIITTTDTMLDTVINMKR